MEIPCKDCITLSMCIAHLNNMIPYDPTGVCTRLAEKCCLMDKFAFHSDDKKDKNIITVQKFFRERRGDCNGCIYGPGACKSCIK